MHVRVDSMPSILDDKVSIVMTVSSFIYDISYLLVFVTLLFCLIAASSALVLLFGDPFEHVRFSVGKDGTSFGRGILVLGVFFSTLLMFSKCVCFRSCHRLEAIALNHILPLVC